MSSSDNVARLKWAGEEDSPYRDLFPSINVARDPQPLQFYLKKPSFTNVTEDFTTGIDEMYTLITSCVVVQ